MDKNRKTADKLKRFLESITRCDLDTDAEKIEDLMKQIERELLQITGRAEDKTQKTPEERKFLFETLMKVSGDSDLTR